MRLNLNIILFLGTPVCWGFSDVLVPIRIDRDGVCEVGSKIAGEHDVPMRLFVGTGASISEDVDIDIHNPEVISFVPRDTSMPVFEFTEKIQTERRWSILGVGPGSAVLEETESIAVVKNMLNKAAGDLVLYSRYETFLDSCVPGTVLNGKLKDGSHEVRVEVVPSIRSSLSSGPATFPRFSLANAPGLIVVAPETYEEIYSTMKGHGAVELDARQIMHEPMWMKNCPYEIVELLPTIKFRFVHGDGSAVFDVFPRDYIRFDEAAGTCELRVSVAPPRATPYVYINPMQIADMNVRFTKDGSFQICRSAYTGMLAVGSVSTSRESTMVVMNAPLAPVTAATTTTVLPSDAPVRAMAAAEAPAPPMAAPGIGDRVRRFMGHLRRLVSGHRYKKLHDE